MTDSGATENDFLKQLTEQVEKNISNENFGVSELADAMSMSRSNLLRKVKKETKLSVSQLINQIRLKRGMEILRKTSHNVSEVSHQVGFSSTSYFIKCFREYYGYPPGEVSKREAAGLNTTTAIEQSDRSRSYVVVAAVSLIVILAVSLFMYFGSPFSRSENLEKSIAVLPFKNDSNDSTNVYLINGLMESTLNNLQKIKELKVISRTSTEKYRNVARSIPEMSEDLNVNYFVEGSGQKIGDQILLNIQLIEGPTDRHLWAKQYRREAKDIFALQQEIAKSIAEEIQVLITPEEKKRIEKIPTDDLVAYDFFLKGIDHLRKGSDSQLLMAIENFNKATEKDPKFALSYAYAVIAYYYLEIYKADKKHTATIGSLADKALLHDPRLAEGLVAKAIFYLQKKEHEAALPYLEKSFEYNPNSSFTLDFLTDYYTNYSPNTSKYLEYALKALRIGVDTRDSVSTSYTYLRLSNALMQSGFFKEALENMDKSLEYFPDNPYAYIEVYMHLAIDNDCPKAKERLLAHLKKDSTRLDIIQEIAKVSCLMGDYPEAAKYYNKFINLRNAYRLDIYKHESLRMAFVFNKVGQKAQAEEFVKTFKQYADNDRSIYKHALLSSYYDYRGNKEKAIEHLRLFGKEDDFLYWVLFFNDDPMLDNLKDDPEVKKILKGLEYKFWKRHEKMKLKLQEEGLI